MTEITITFLSRLLLSLVFSLIWERRESEFAFLILCLKPLSNVVEFDARDSLVFLIYSKEQISQSERVLFCIVDSQQMGVLRRTCTDRRVSATVLRARHGKHIQSTVSTVSQVMTKNETFPLIHSLACANYAIYVAKHACIGYAKKAVKIRKVMMTRVANKHIKQDP